MSKKVKRKSAWVTVYARRVAALQKAFDDGLAELQSDRHGNEHLANRHARKIRYLGLALLEDLFGVDHPMCRDFDEDTRSYSAGSFENAKGLADALETIVNDEWLSKTRAEIAGAIFADYVNMSEHLAEQGMESAAVVLAMGSV